MADEKKTSGSDTLGIIFKNPKPKPDESATSPMAELYGRSLSSISDPNKRDIRAFNLENAFSETTLEEGTIVSDRRKDRPGFFENVGAAFSEWQKKTFGSLRKVSADGAVKNKPSVKAREKESVAIPRASKTNDSTSHVEKMRVMQHDLDAHTVTASVPKKDSAPALQKIRTFKSDAALLQGTPENKTSVQITPKPEPKPQPVVKLTKEKVPEPKPEIEAPSKRDPEPPIVKRDARLFAPDAHISMVAPEVSMRLQTDATSFIPGGNKEDTSKKEVAAKQPVHTYVPHIPDTVSRPSQKSVVKEIAPTSLKETTPTTENVEMPQWTHLSKDTKTAPDVARQESPLTPMPPPVKPEPALRESATPILPHETRSIESEQPLREIRSEQVAETTPANLPVAEDAVQIESEPTPIIPVKQPFEVITEDTALSKTNARSSEEPGAETTFHGNEAVHTASGETKIPLAPTTQSASVSRPNQRAETTHSFQFIIRMVLALIGVGTLIVLGALFFTQEKDSPTANVDLTVPQTPSTSSTTPSVPPQDSRSIMLSENPHMFLTAIARAIAEAPAGLTYLAVYTGEPLRNATAQEFFGHLQTTLMPRAIRALHPEFIIGSIATTRNEPFILIRSDNFDTLFAGLLAWEPSMQQELAPLFGAPRLDETAFSDAVRNNKSIRILRNSDDEEVLLYSFINERTVIITASSDALAQLIGRF